MSQTSLSHFTIGKWFVLGQWCHPGLRFSIAFYLKFLNKIVWFQIHTHLKFQKYQTDLKFYLIDARRIKKIKNSTLPSHNTTKNTKTSQNTFPRSLTNSKFCQIVNQLCKSYGVRMPLRYILFEFRCFKIVWENIQTKHFQDFKAVKFYSEKFIIVKRYTKNIIFIS